MKTKLVLMAVGLVMLLISCKNEDQSQLSKMAAKEVTSNTEIGVTPDLSVRTYLNYQHDVFYCRTGELWMEYVEREDWFNKMEDKLQCRNYRMSKKNVNRFVNELNKTDSFKIWGLEGFSIDEAALDPAHTVLDESGIGTITCLLPQYCIGKSKADSAPLKFYISYSDDRVATMNVCADSIMTEELSQFIKEKKYGRLMIRQKQMQNEN